MILELQNFKIISTKSKMRQNVVIKSGIRVNIFLITANTANTLSEINNDHLLNKINTNNTA